jgi:hypothetical protein
MARSPFGSCIPTLSFKVPRSVAAQVEAPNTPGERRPTGTELRVGTEPALWAVRSTGLFGQGYGTARPAPSLLVCGVFARTARKAWRRHRCLEAIAPHQPVSAPCATGTAAAEGDASSSLRGASSVCCDRQGNRRRVCPPSDTTSPCAARLAAAPLGPASRMSLGRWCRGQRSRRYRGAAARGRFSRA